MNELEANSYLTKRGEVANNSDHDCIIDILSGAQFLW